METKDVKLSLAEEYRLETIKKIKLEFENEIETRKASYKNYNKAFNIINVSEGVLKTTALGMGSVGIGFLSIAMPIAVGLEIGTLSLGALSLVSKFINSKLLTKAKKHNNICILAEAKLDTIKDLITKALNDSKISEEEFSLIRKEQSKFRLMKEELRKKSFKAFMKIDKKCYGDLQDYTDSPDSKSSKTSSSKSS